MNKKTILSHEKQWIQIFESTHLAFSVADSSLIQYEMDGYLSRSDFEHTTEIEKIRSAGFSLVDLYHRAQSDEWIYAVSKS